MIPQKQAADSPKPYRSPYEAYPFLSEPASDLRCDFELLTDELASLTGLLRSQIPEADTACRDELRKICELVYHFNPTLRTSFEVRPDETEWLLQRVQTLQQETEPAGGFVLPLGTEPACTAHAARVCAKRLVRLLYAHMEQGHEAASQAVDFANLLSGYFFLLALHLNRRSGTEEIMFTSRVYGPLSGGQGRSGAAAAAE